MKHYIKKLRTYLTKKRKWVFNMKMKNQTYDTIKWIVQVFAPGLMGLIAGFGSLGLIGNTETIVAVIGLVTAFVGSLIGISSVNYNKQNKE